MLAWRTRKDTDLVDGNGVGNAIAGVENNAGGATRRVKRHHRLHCDIECRDLNKDAE